MMLLLQSGGAYIVETCDFSSQNNCNKTFTGSDIQPARWCDNLEQVQLQYDTLQPIAAMIDEHTEIKLDLQ